MTEPLPFVILNVDDVTPAATPRAGSCAAPAIGLLEASTGADGLRLVGEIKPQLLLLDVNLPDMSGLDVAASLKSQSLNPRHSRFTNLSFADHHRGPCVRL